MRRLAPAILVIVTILSYLPVFQNGFVYDDHFQLERNPYIRDFRHLNILLTKEVWHFSPWTNSNNYRPLHMISYLLIYKMFGFNPVVFHASALLFYIASVLLVWKIYCHYVRALPAFLGALLFATHPVHVESVAWIGGFPDLMCGMFLFLSFLSYLRGRNPLSLLFFLFALFSKETSLVFPLFIAVDHLLFHGQEKRKIIFWGAGAAVLLLLYTGLRIYSLGAFMRTEGTLIPLSMLHSGMAFTGLYLAKMFFPVELNAFYHFTLPLSLNVSWPGFLLLFSVLILVYAFRRNKLFLLACSWFGVFLLPALFIKEVSPVLFAERYLYLPSAGFLLAVISLPLKRHVPAVLLAISVIFAGLSYSRSKVWRDDLTLWSDTVEKSPLSAIANFNLATAYLHQKDYQFASNYYKKSAELDPHKAETYYNLAKCEYMLGRNKQAIDSLKKFLQYSSTTDPMRKDAEMRLRQLSKSTF